MLASSDVRRYDPDDDGDLPGFAGSLTACGALLATAVTAGRLAGVRLPARVDPVDLAVGAIAVHKASRLVSKSSVTSPLRAPFTRFERPAGSAEHDESAREGSRWRHTIGELLTCPFCMDVWIATAYVAGLVAAPRHARVAASLLAVVGGADWLQQAYQRLKG